MRVEKCALAAIGQQDRLGSGIDRLHIFSPADQVEIMPGYTGETSPESDLPGGAVTAVAKCFPIVYLRMIQALRAEGRIGACWRLSCLS
ncbi:hypothetical protein OG884_02725 [Streptosporangium sp. NBC_01755]|uniref:hypothetical protein n=1 Tax=unclassified Streptosporangium TaxID=2632669 RepID=UPI002DDA864B|nr:MULTISPECIES: hypothetical protein [unclassified Streptosporangium]WSA27654.1 hypothetical protein OIE13_07215 [Streptosporangium sp. NBC_01810]WSD00871.1 hypothetical protein OG884_02725 [Streptosporangium sp. NBC_01755]